MGLTWISIAFLSYFILSSAFFYLLAGMIWLLTRWFDRRLIGLHLFSSFWAFHYIQLMPLWSFSLHGREKLCRHEPCIMVANHQSLLDILVIFGLFVPFKWVSKQEIFKLPLLGWNMALNGYIGLVRGDRESGKKMLRDCARALEAGSSICLFPEGTRSASGLVKDFKPGAFILAHEKQVPIQPLVINGSKNALPKNSFRLAGLHQIRLEVLEPIAYAEFAHLSVEATAAWVRERIIAHVQEHQPGETLGQSSDARA